MTKILVTGSSGFVGQHFARMAHIAPLEMDGKFVDLLDVHGVEAAVAAIRPDAVVHLAAQSFVPESFRDPLQTYQVNFIGTHNLLGALKAAGFPGRMLYVSSAEVYGAVPDAELPVRESQPLKPLNPYSVSKIAAEALCYQWSQTEQFEVIVARPFNHIGPGQSERFAISDFAKRIVEIKRGHIEPVFHVGDIDTMRDFTDVRDVVRAYIALLATGRNGEIYNICSQREYSIRFLLTSMLEMASVQAEIVRDESRFRASQHRRMLGSYDKLHSDTQWRVEIPMERSLGDVLDYWTEKQPIAPSD
jgi:GDP-4-dehydro-6-deoxy-D-mannose reductase